MFSILRNAATELRQTSARAHATFSIVLVILTLLLACSGPPEGDAAEADDVQATGIPGAEEGETAEQAMERQWAEWNDPVKQKVAPFRIFDNLSYIGMEWVSAYVLETSDGLILIDTLYGDFVEHAVDGIEALGLDPDDIKIVLPTHGHFDHDGGIEFFKDTYGAQIGMTEADWQMSEAQQSDSRFAYPTIARDLVIEEGDQITLGDTTITAHVTPGHTEGVLSLDFQVHDGDDSYRAFTFGGVGLNFSGVERTESYLDSVARIRQWNEQGDQPISVNVSNHPFVGKIFERRDLLAERAEGDPHPFVDPEGYLVWLDEIEAAAQAKLEQEKAAAAE